MTFLKTYGYGVVITFILANPIYCLCQQTESGLPPMKLIRYEENYDTLRLSSAAPFIEKIKHLNLGKEKNYISFGGEARLAFEQYNNQLFGSFHIGKDNFWLTRSFLHADVHLNSFRIYLQLADGVKLGGFGKPLPIQQDKLFLHQAFAEWSKSKNAKHVIMRVGRQELQVGSGRILSTRVGPNVRQSFDVARIILLGFSKWSYTAFYGRPVLNQPGIFDNPTFSSQAPDFWNIATSGKWGKVNVDAYYFGFRDKNASFQQGTGKELRHSFGGRFSSGKKLDYDAEVLYQFGTFNGGTIHAYTASINAGYTFTNSPLKPRLGLKTEYISGDKDTSNANLQTFNALFPEGGYFGGVNALGPSNLYDIHPSLELKFPHHIQTRSAVAFVWRASLQDGLYNPGRILFVKNKGYNPYRYVGTQVQQTASWAINRYWSLRFIYAHFFAGDYLKYSNPKRFDIDFFTGLLTFQF